MQDFIASVVSSTLFFLLVWWVFPALRPDDGLDDSSESVSERDSKEV